MSIEVAVIGAGSIGFTRGLIGDTLGVPEFADTLCIGGAARSGSETARPRAPPASGHAA